MASEWVIRISPQHPSLPGHFPGHPVVPGVVILEEVIAGIRQLDPELVVAGLPAVKLSSPLKPGEPLTITIERAGAGEMEFRCRVADRSIASGIMQIRPRTTERTGRR